MGAARGGSYDDVRTVDELLELCSLIRLPARCHLPAPTLPRLLLHIQPNGLVELAEGDATRAVDVDTVEERRQLLLGKLESAALQRAREFLSIDSTACIVVPIFENWSCREQADMLRWQGQEGHQRR